MYHLDKVKEFDKFGEIKESIEWTKNEEYLNMIKELTCLNESLVI